MAHSYKNIVITPNTGANSDPTVQFSGGNTTVNTDITLRVYPDSNGTLSFEGSAGQLFSVTNDLTGSLFAVNDVSGIPLIEVNVTSQQITFGEFYGNVGIGKAASTSSTYKLDVNGTINASNVLINGNAITGSVTSLTPANNYSNTLYSSALAAGNSAANSANAYTVTVGAAANVTHWIYANGVANSANAYAVTVGAASNNWANTLGTNTALAYSWTNTHTFSSNVFYRNTSSIVWITNAASTTSNVTLKNYPDSNGTLSFEGSAGQLFSITNDLTGSIFSVNDVSGIPLVEVNVSSQQITLGQFYGNVGIGTSAATSSIYKLDVTGAANISLPTLLVSGTNVLASFAAVNTAAYIYANGVANSANAYAVTVGAASNTWANTLSTSDRAIANAAANSANAYTVTVGAASNTWANTVSTSDRAIANAAANSANAYTVTVGAASNTWANSIGAASNTWANTLSTVDRAIANAAANSANAYANGFNAKVFVSTTDPTSNVNGSLWWNSNLGRLFVYYTDGDSSQWVETNPVPDVYAITNSAIQSYTVSANNWANTKLANTTGTFAGTLTATGNVAASFFLGNGSLLSAIPAYNNTSIQVFTTGTGASYTAPSGLKSALVIVTGGGGGAGGADASDTGSGAAGGGGGAGGTAIKLFTAAEMTGATYTVGAAGGAGSATNGTNGTGGGNTSFTPSSGNILFGYGGDFGNGSGLPTVGASATGGDGGSGANGTMIIDGGDGNFGVGDDVGEMGIGGMGGSSFWGGGGWGGAAWGAAETAGGAGMAYGSGGGGGGTVDSTTGANGGDGKAGVVFVLEFRS